jgi:putative ABC transport system permease protein
MAGSGVAIGLTLALGLSRFLGSLLFGVPPHDVLVGTIVTTILAVVALGSGLVPALRAARTDPMEALKAE